MSVQKLISTSLCLVFSAFLLSACSSEPIRPAAAPSGVTKLQWMQALPESMSEELCAQDSPYVRCYPLSANDCATQARAMTIDCEQRMAAQLPGSMLTPDMVQWGSKIGECAGDALLHSLETRYGINNTPECMTDEM